MPAFPPAAARQGTQRKKAARSCQSLEFKKVIMVGSRKSLLVLHTQFQTLEVRQDEHLSW